MSINSKLDDKKKSFVHFLKVSGIFTQTIQFVLRMRCVQNMLIYGLLSHLIVEHSKSF